ncbi:ATP-dependent endonuclease [Candidatus Thiodubiliella endoseptemdiera]|uniref:ATP-dependent nuclease n=1 Tax=Candidatus Thiodubiliella endoseptemdiera TaxID=2738886 RepID=UPI0034E04E17
MRLKKLSVKGFKNLKNFKINFESQDGITVLIGNNASGKSNVLEAISAIFKFLYDFEKPSLNLVNFYFDITYSINDCEVNCFRNKQYDIGFKVKERGKKNFKHKDMTGFYEVINNYSTTKVYKYLPSQVIALYSGEELRMWNYYYRQFYLTYNKNIISGNEIATNNQKMLYVNKYYWDIALLVMIISDIDVSDIIDSNIKRFNIGLHSKNIEKFHKTPNLVTQFVHDIAYIKNNKESTHQYCHSKTETIENFKTLVADTHRQLFNLLCVAYLPKDDKDKLIANLELHFENGTTTKDFSEGRKKQILLKLALEVLPDENSLLLFDEPDAHIHIANKKLIPEILENYNNREIILTTHSPTLAHSFDNKHLAYIENGKINENYNTQEKLLNELTGDLMGVSEQQLFLQSNKDILIVEGKTDEAYISQALKILKQDNSKYESLDFNFLWLGGTDVDTLNKIISEFKPKTEQTIIAFFDNDDSGYKCIKKTLDINVDKKDFDGGIKNNIHIELYPKKNGFTCSDFEVEDYFPIDILIEFVTKKSKTFQEVKSKFNKVKFADECKNDDFEKSNFDGFKPLFDKILETKKKSKDAKF